METGDDVTTILILHNHQFKVDSKKLRAKSQYFNALLSENYNDHHKKEHVIDYPILLSSMQTVIIWIEDDRDNVSNLNPVLECDDIKDLLDLFHVGVLFGIDDLINELTYMVEVFWLTPEYIIKIWLFAQSFSLNLLEDVCLAACLDRFNDLILSSLCELSKNNIMKLLGNVNLRFTKEHLELVVSSWQSTNKDSLPIDLTREKKPAFLRSIATPFSPTQNDIYIYCWEDEYLFEFDKITYPSGVNNRLKGMQIIGRGLNIYLVGGEYGIGSGRFEGIIWRYSLLSRKWFHEANVLTPRRHMVAAFLENSLILAGGVGKHRIKLNSVEVYNVHNRTWFTAMPLSVLFNDVPKYFIFKEKLIILIVNIHIYDVHLNIWQEIDTTNWGLPINVPVFAFEDTFCYIDVLLSNCMILSTIMCFDMINNDMPCENPDFPKDLPVQPQIIMEHTALFRLIIDFGHLFVIAQHDVTNSQFYHSHHRKIENPLIFTCFMSDSYTPFFHIMDPDDLTKTINTT